MVNTLNSSISTGINLDGSGSNDQSPFTVTANGTIVTSGFAVSDTTGSASLLNQGLVESTAGDGIFFNQGGEVDNSGSSATISGFFPAVAFTGAAAGTIINDGTIVSTHREAVYLGGGGSINNTGAAALIEGASYGVQAEGFTTLLNAGQVIGGQKGAAFYAGGSISNSGTISGADGVYISNGPAMIFNTGSITGTSASGGAFGVSLAGSGAVTNSGTAALISGYAALKITGSGSTVQNAGQITGQTSGVLLQSGGGISNASTGTISTASGIAVGAGGTDSTVDNAGTIASQGSGFGNYGVSLGGGGTVTNTGFITGYRGIRIDDAAGSVYNWSTVTGGYAAIQLGDGGLVSTNGLATGQNGIVINGAAGTVDASGIVTGSSGSGIALGAGGYVLAGPGATITGSADGVDIFAAAGTILNNSSIIGSNNDGVYLAAGGTVNNAASAYIAGGNTGVAARNAPATLFNYGTVTSSDIGADFSAGGYIENSRGTAVITGSVLGLRAQGAVTVMNNGSITGASGGVDAGSGGYVANIRPNALISGYTAVYTGGTNPSTVLNEGTIAGDASNGNRTTGVYLGQGGTVTNLGTAALITGYKAVTARLNTGTLQNQGGTITGTGIAVELFQGGSVNNNGTTALITGGYAGIEIFANPGTVTNNGGTITLTGHGDAISMQQGGYVYNSAPGLISASETAVYINGQPGSVVNRGSITGTNNGIFLRDGGTVSNLGTSATVSGHYGAVVLTGSGAVYNTGSLFSSQEHGAALYAGGTVTNYGTAAVMSGYNGGIYIGGGSGTVLNQGLVQASGSYASALALAGGGTITNSGSITGYNGVNVEGGNGTVINAGSITGSPGSDGYGIRFYGSGDVQNNGTAASISGGRYGIGIRGTGTVANDGTITSAAGRGIYLGGGGTVSNTGTAAVISGQAGGVLIGSGTGLVDNAGTITGPIAVSLYGGGTVINSGTVSGSNYAVRFGNGNDLLVEDSGAVINGRVKAFGGNNTLALGSGAGSLSGIGSSITGFSTIALDAGATWTLSGNSAGLAAPGVTITGFGLGDALDLTDFAATSASYIAGSGLVLSNATASETIALTAKQPNSSFAVSSDGTGTDITELGIHTLVTNYTGQLTITSGGAYLNAFTIASGVTVSTTQGTMVSSAVAGASLTNFGTIYFQPGFSVGQNPAVELTNGGTVENLGTTALISGFYGVKIDHAAGLVYNEGTITGDLPNNYRDAEGVILNGGGTVINSGSTALIGGTENGVVLGGTGGAVLNSGTITAASGSGVLLQPTFYSTYTSGSGFGFYTIPFVSGYVGNLGTTALISGGQFGVMAQGVNATVFNQGTISGQYGVRINGSGLIDNSGTQALISGYNNSVYLGTGAPGQSATLINQGTILASGTSFSTAVTGWAYPGSGSGVSVLNTGLISASGTSGTGVYLSNGGYVANTGTAAIISGSTAGILIKYAYGAALNTGGSIIAATGTGVSLTAGGYVSNHGTTALISGGSLGVDIKNAYGYVSNSGSISGGLAGIRIQSGTLATVANAGGTITGGNTGIYLAAKNNSAYNTGVIANTASGSIESFGVLLGGAYIPPSVLASAPPGFLASTPLTFNDTQYGGTSFLSNTSTGSITSTDIGVGLASSGNATVLNQGVISGGTYGVYQLNGFTGPSSYYAAVVNTGTISGGTDGIVLTSRFNVVVNDGTISGGTDAVYLKGAFKTLIADQNAVFNGQVVASSGGYSRLILTTAYGPGTAPPTTPGTITGIGSQITGFENINIYSGNSWLVSGNAAGLASGQFINGFLSGNEIDLTNVQADSESFANNVLTLFEAGNIVGTLNIYAENATSGSFALSNDGSLGTDITRLPSNPHALSASLNYGITLTPTGRYNSPYTVTNTGTINSGATGIYSTYAASVTVYGSVSGYQGGIVLTAGGTVVAAGLISGATSGSYGNTAAVQISGGAADVVVETGASFTGIVIADTVYNNILDSETISLGGIGTQFQGFTTIDLGAAARTIAGTAQALTTGETINGFAPGDTIDITNGQIDSVSLANGTLTLFNGGSPEGSLAVNGAGPYSTDFALVSDGGTGTDLIALATRTISTTLNTGVTLAPNLTYSNDLVITNTGAVLDSDATGRAVYQSGAGHISIASGATVAGWISIYQKNGAGATITNAGQLNAVDFGIALHQDGTVLNTGTITGGQYGVAAYQTGTIDNHGLITGGIAGIYIGGTFGKTATIENAGTISGSHGIAISINGAADVIADAGAVFVGNVVADPSQSDVLELSSSATTGTISGIGTSFTGFSTIEIDSGAKWVISGDSAGLAAGQTIIGNGTIDITDLKADSSSYANGTLSLYENGTLAGTLNIETARPASSSDFTVYTDGANGTEIVLDQPSPYVISTSLSTGVTLNPTGAYRSPLTITNTGAVHTTAYYGIFSSGGANILNNGYIADTTGRYVLALNGTGNNVTNEAGGTITGRLHLGGAGANTLINQGSINAFGLIGGSSAYLHNEAGGNISGGSQIGFVASNTTVVNAGTIAETSNGLALNAGGTVTNQSGGSITGNSDGIVLAHGLVSNAGYIGGGTGIYAGGRTTVQNAGTIAGTSGTAINFGHADADLIAAPGAVFIGNVIASAGHNNTLELTGGTAAGTLTGLNSQFTNFNNIIDDNNAAWTLSGVNATNTIDITGFTTTSGTLTIGATDELTIGNLTLSFASGDTGGLLTIASDGHGGTEITNVLCFLEGTNIATPHGETPVEHLKIGDPILTADGQTVPVRWIGLHTAATRFADPLRIMPIRIRQGALGNNLPTRDLLLSPDHAMYLGGLLVQAGALVNGTSITRERNMPERFTYYHVETASHDLILAEGAPAETFVDNVDRMAFDNWAEHEALYGNHTPIAEMPHPRAKSARQIPPTLRRQLAAAAQAVAGAAA